jgi:hypothetical protein
MVRRGTSEGWCPRQGKVMSINAHKPCSCGSGKNRCAIYDGYNIFLTFTCEDCHEKRISRFRPDIFTRYKTEERIEPED